MLVLPDEVDLATAPDVRDQLMRGLNRGNAHLIVDARQTAFMDSAGVNALVRARERAELLGGSLHVVTTSAPVVRVLELTGLARVVGLVPDVERAIDCVARPSNIHSCQ